MTDIDKILNNIDSNLIDTDSTATNIDAEISVPITYDLFIPLGSDSLITFDSDEFYVRAA